MNTQDRKAWIEKTQRLNEGIELKRGMEVKDVYGKKGIVVKIIPENPENPIEEHGAIYLWQSEKTEYGADNCEHYCYHNWQSFLRIQDEGVYLDKRKKPTI